jgi:hypothetical protein
VGYRAISVVRRIALSLGHHEAADDPAYDWRTPLSAEVAALEAACKEQNLPAAAQARVTTRAPRAQG